MLRGRFLFLLLILAQAAHSIEEYVQKLYDVFVPARLVSRVFSSDPAVGFVIFNAAVVAFGLWSWAVPIRLNRSAARPLLWFWAGLECANGVGHLVLGASNGGYFPGMLTAPLLLLFGAALGLALRGAAPRYLPHS